MKKKIFSLIFALFLMIFCLPIISGCEEPDNEPEQFLIVFLVDDQEYATVTTAGRDLITLPQNPTKADYIFDGWYFDRDFTRELCSDSFIDDYLTRDIVVYSKWILAEYGPFVLTQASTNYTGQILSQVVLNCSKHTDCVFQWQKPNSVLNNAIEKFNVNHIKDGVITTQTVEITAIAKLNASYCFQDMLFTLNASKGTATVKANSDNIVNAIIPAKVSYNGTTYVVDRIDNRGFYDIDTLKYIYVPASIKTFGGVTFAHNDNLETAELDKNLTAIGTQMFMYCHKLQNITIPQGVKTIPSGFLYQCYKIDNIDIPSGVTKIDSSAFYGTGLTSVDLPDGLLEIGAHAFAGTALVRVEIPATVNFIDKKAFSTARSLEEIAILSKNVEIGLEAFSNCYNLRTVFLNSAALVNGITTNTQDTTHLIYNMQNSDILYISNDISVTSPYITELYTKVDSSKAGYNAYQLGKYTQLSSQNFVDRIYVKGSDLWGDETIRIKTPNNTWQTISLNKSMIEGFDTSTVGKKMAKITYKYNVITCVYYVLSSIDSTELNCISQVNNFYPTYYIGESLNLNNVRLEYHYNQNGYMVYTISTVTANMISNFDTTRTGTRIATFTKNESTYQLRYHVKSNPNETITSQSFSKGVYYDKDTTEETEHFIINIEKGSYISADYKTIIEKIFDTEEKVSGLKFDSKITIDVDDTNYPSCGGLELYLTPSDLLFSTTSAFTHELAHALDHSQTDKFLATSVLTEGFATYVEYLTIRELYLSDPVTYAYSGTMISVLNDVDLLGDKIYFYDFENYLLNIGRDELVGNSQYEVGAKFFAYLDYRYGDFCSWMTSTTYKTNNLNTWKVNIKNYYNNSKLFDEMYNYYQLSGDKYHNFLGADYNTNLTSRLDLTAINKYNYFFNFGNSLDYQGSVSMTYKDLYINIESARDQLQKSNIQYNALHLRSTSGVSIQLYDASGSLIQTISGNTNNFSLEGVSFIKLTGTNATTLYLTYA